MSPQPASKPSRRAELLGRQALFVTWLTTSPFVTSFVEDSQRGTTRTTRSNTLANRTNLLPQHFPNSLSSTKLDKATPKRTRYIPPEPSSSSTITSLSDTVQDPPRRNISFAQVALVYSEDNPGMPEEENIKNEPRPMPLEVRRKRAALMAHQNPHMPTSAAGKWLLKKA